MARDVAIMSEISNIGFTNSYAATFRASSTANLPDNHNDPADGLGNSDPVEISRMGRLLAAEATDTSSLRLAKIQALRAQIADGTFETQERLMGTVDRLIKELE